MIRSMMAIVAGYLSISFLNDFSHAVTSLYFRHELSLTGIANLPAPAWGYGFAFLQLILGLFAGLLTSTIVKTKGSLEILALILLIVAAGCIDYSVLSNREPLWYLITSPALKVLGIYLGFILKQKQDASLKANK